MRNYVITGIPRSGTTLATSLLGGQPGFFAIQEPLTQVEESAGCADGQAFARYLVGSFRDLGRRLARGEAISDRRREDGTPLTDYFQPGDGRSSCAVWTDTVVDPGTLTGLCVKHNALYTATLDRIVETGFFDAVVCLIRNPLDVIASWRSLSLPISQGRLPAGEKYCPVLRAIAASDRPVLEKQVRIYDYFLERYTSLAAGIRLFTYEGQIERGFTDVFAAVGLSFCQPGLVRKRHAVDAEVAACVRAQARQPSSRIRDFYPEIC